MTSSDAESVDIASEQREVEPLAVVGIREVLIPHGFAIGGINGSGPPAQPEVKRVRVST